MANQKPKKSAKKPAAKADTGKSAKTTKETKAPVVEKAAPVAVASTCEHPMKGFFARKCDKNENILTIFKTPKVWGALIGEMIGTMLLVMLLLMYGFGLQPTYVVLGALCIYIGIVSLSGAHLNPLITAGMMATRRMSAIRGVLYMLAQLLGAWIGMIILNAFRLGSGTTTDLPMMTEVAPETFWGVALIELMGAIILGFCFARAIRYARRSPLTFAVTVVSSIILAIIFGLVVSQLFFNYQSNYIFNPVAALMYQILPTVADGFGELVQTAGLAIAAYILVPVIGGIAGFYISDVATRLSCGGYFSEVDEPEAKK